MQFIFPPAVWAAIITVSFSALFALVGVIYRLLTASIDDVGEDTDGLDERLTSVERRVRTLFFWAFGHEEDSTDHGFAADIQEKLASLNEKLEDISDKEDVRHAEVVERLDELILLLDDEEVLDFERDDIE